MEEATLEERVKEWHNYLSLLAEKFYNISKDCNYSKKEMEIAFDELKDVFELLWI